MPKTSNRVDEMPFLRHHINMAKRRSRAIRKKKNVRRGPSRTRKARRAKEHKKVFVPIFEGILGSLPRARILRWLYRHTGTSFSEGQIARMLMLSISAVHRELEALASVGIARMRTGGKFRRFQINPAFPFFEEVRLLALFSNAVPASFLVDALSRTLKPKLIVTSGVFMNIPSSAVDLFVVGEGYSEKKLEFAMRRIEAQLGSELRWSGMVPKEFSYRWKMFDRFVRSIFEGPHEIVLGKLPK